MCGDGELVAEVVCGAADSTRPVKHVIKMDPTYPGLHRISFTPQRGVNHYVYLRFNGDPVPVQDLQRGADNRSSSDDMFNTSSSFNASSYSNYDRQTALVVHVLDLSEYVADGPGLDVIYVNQPTHMRIYRSSSSSHNHLSSSSTMMTQDMLLDDKSCDVVVTDSRGDNLPVSVTSVEGGRYLRAEYIPRFVGEHEVAVRYSGQSIPGSPFTPYSYDFNKIRIVDLPRAAICDRPVKFLVDCSESGMGELECKVKSAAPNNKDDVVCEVRQRNGKLGGVYDVTFTPRQATPHYVYLTYNKMPILNSTTDSNITTDIDGGVRVDVVDVRQGGCVVGGQGIRLVPIHKQTSFSVDTHRLPRQTCLANITGPSHTSVPVKVQGDHQTGYTASYTPTKIGAHHINVEYGGVPIQDSPFTAWCYDASKISVSGLSKAMLGKPTHFYVDASEAGRGNLEIEVGSQGGLIPNYVKAEGKLVFRVEFTPRIHYTHHINIRFNGQAING